MMYIGGRWFEARYHTITSYLWFSCTCECIHRKRIATCFTTTPSKGQSKLFSRNNTRFDAAKDIMRFLQESNETLLSWSVLSPNLSSIQHVRDTINSRLGNFVNFQTKPMTSGSKFSCSILICTEQCMRQTSC